MRAQQTSTSIIHEGDKIAEEASKALIRAALALNRSVQGAGQIESTP
jgi:hypothetical protein